MTLIACTINHKIPFLIGDLIVSSDSTNESIQLPTNVIDINKYLKKSNPSFPVGLYQKIYIIKKNICIGLAGNFDEMSEFLIEFKTRCSYYEQMEASHIQTFIDGYDYEEKFSRSAFFILFKSENSIAPLRFCYPNDEWKFIESDIFEVAYANGSGRTEFLGQINRMGNFQTFAPKGEIKRAVSSNISLITKLLAAERVTLFNIDKNWGAGYEAIFYNGNSFEKLKETVYMISVGHYDLSGDIGIPMPKLVMYYKYHNDLLLITSIEILEYERKDVNGFIIITANANNIKVDLFVVPPIDRKDEEITMRDIPKNISFQTNRIGFGYALIKKNASIFLPTFFSELPYPNIVYKHNESIQITLHTNINEIFRKEAKNMYSKL